jgi:hypothetical protein
VGRTGCSVGLSFGVSAAALGLLSFLIVGRMTHTQPEINAADEESSAGVGAKSKKPDARVCFQGRAPSNARTEIRRVRR